VAEGREKCHLFDLPLEHGRFFHVFCFNVTRGCSSAFGIARILYLSDALELNFLDCVDDPKRIFGDTAPQKSTKL
jgi:hypothetical protein